MNPNLQGSVVHLLWSGGVGGIERLVVDLAMAQRELGTDVRLAFGQAEGPFVKRAERQGLPVLDLGVRSGYHLAPRSLAGAARLLAESECVHLHGFNLPFAIAASRSGRPIVYTEHGFTKRSPSDLPATVKQVSKRWFLRKRVSIVAANSSFTASRLAASLGIPLDHVHVVHNGIDIDGLRPPTARPARDGIAIACVSRLVDWKRVDRALQAVALAADPSIQLVVVGDGPLRQDLEELARRLGVGTQVRFLGFQEKVPDILVNIDVLVHPSRDEWFGLSVVEAAAQGLLPIVFADAGGALEVLPPGGVVVSDVRALAQTLVDLHDSDRLSSTARRGRAEWARHAFPIQLTAEHYADLYATAVGRPRAMTHDAAPLSSHGPGALEERS